MKRASPNILALSSWNLFEKLWLASFCLIGGWLAFRWGENFFGFSVFLSGILCVVLAAKGHIATYPVGMYNNFGYAYIAWTNHLFGEMSLYLFFYVPTSVIGFFMWRRHLEDARVEMRALRPRVVCAITVGSVACIAALGFGLSLLPTQNTPYADATTNALSVVATFLMMARYREQWIAYIALNIFSIALWAFRALDGSPDAPLMIVMWSAFLVNAIYGYINWSKGVRDRAR